MTRSTHAGLAAAFALAGAAGLANAQFIIALESSDDRALLLDAFDGSVINSNFLDIGAAAGAAGVSSTPIEALTVGNEIWVSDQVADRIWRFGSDGSFIGDIGVGQLDNIRGMHQVGNTVYVAMANDSAFAEGIVTIDAATGMVTGSFNGRDAADTSYWDVIEYNGELLVSNSDSGNDGLERYSFDGTYLGNLASSDGTTSFDFVQQMHINGDGNILAAGFSSPAGVYEIASDGTDLGIVAAQDLGPRGVYELGNGEILWTNGTFLRTDSTIIEEGSSFRWLSGTSVPTPGAVAIAGLAGLGAARRRH